MQWKWDSDPHEKITQIQGGNSTRAPAAHMGRAGWPDTLAELELKATHTHVCIDHDLIHELE